ncbi:hypothetical protein EYS14_11020 [Alteromonadaceae bacterium M269]|nr:hypothetical protein EYS14_11020 [Alteromonadaceae bacterium M269]
MLAEKLKHFVDDLSTQESATVVNDHVVAYTKAELEGDAIHWMTNELSQSEPLNQLHKAQQQLAHESRLAALSVSTQLLKTLIK